jgi:SAM-dependent methyltransferase
MNGTSEFADKTCSAPPGRSARMREIVLAHVPADRKIRFLDVGCGTGVLLFHLHDALPAAELIGIDVSTANIQAAESERRQRRSERPALVAADYLRFDLEPVDVIVADGVIQLIPGATAEIFQKLARDLRPGGILICSLPAACLHNRLFSTLRRLLSIVRSRWLDNAILWVARLAYGKELDDQGLLERVHYMYVAPERLMDPAHDADVASAGFSLVRQYPMETRFSQLKYFVTVLQRS